MKGANDPIQFGAVSALQSYRYMLRNGYSNRTKQKKATVNCYIKFVKANLWPSAFMLRTEERICSKRCAMGI